MAYLVYVVRPNYLIDESVATGKGANATISYLHVSRSQHGWHGVQRSWVRQVNHSAVKDGQQTLMHVY